jgi:16S rRNA (cytosine1402-N4)-methyltransferase
MGHQPVHHIPVMADQVVALLAPALARPGAVFVDATLGAGGHAIAVARACPGARIVGIDRDPSALGLAQEAFSHRDDAAPAMGERLTVVHAVFDQIGEVVTALGIDRIDAVLFDLGLSSMQVDDDARGFVYSRDVDLDMRMDPSDGVTAAEILNSYPLERLVRILRNYGEEPHAERIARAIVHRRAVGPVTRSGELAELVASAIPARSRRTGRNPAKRTFQALRIEVNGELDALARALPVAIGRLGLGGRIAVLAYHSLEDRLTKRTLAAGAASSAPPDLPVEPEETKPYLRLETRGAQRPTAAEVEANPRSASARLRVAERIREGVVS